MFLGGGEERSDSGEGLCAVHGTEAARDFLFHFHHADIAFGEVVGERDGRVKQAAQNIVFKITQTDEEVVCWTFSGFAPFGGGFAKGRQVLVIVKTALEDGIIHTHKTNFAMR